MSFFSTSRNQHTTSLDFRKFWAGETISSLGSSFTQFALPLLVFKLSGSALNLGIAFAFSYLPYLLFGLVIGAWVDRLDRKRVMIMVDFGQVLVISSIPVLFLLGALSIGWVYAVAFLSTALRIFTEASQFAAIPSLVDQTDLVRANGRIQASFFGATILGPALAGLLISIIPVPTLLFIDAASFLISASTLSLISRSFNLPTSAVGSDGNDGTQRQRRSLRQDMVDGLRYVFGNPVLRNISLMLALVNFLSANRESQLVVLAEQQLHATDFQFGLLNAAGGAGVVLFSLLAGQLGKRGGGIVRLLFIAMQVGGLATIALAFSPTIWFALPLWGIVLGMDNLGNICTGTLRQSIVPNEMLGRSRTIATMMSLGAFSLGALLGGAFTKATGNVVLVYAAVGALIFITITAFSFPITTDARRLRLEEQTSEARTVPVAVKEG